MVDPIPLSAQHPAAIQITVAPDRSIIDPVPDLLCFLVGIGKNILLEIIGKKTHHSGEKHNRKNNPVETQPASLHGCNLVELGQKTQREECCCQGCDRKNIMNEFGQAVTYEFKEQADRFIMLIDIINPLEEGDDHRNHNKAEKDQRKDRQVFSDDVAVQDIGKTEGKARQVPGKLFLLAKRDSFLLSF